MSVVVPSGAFAIEVMAFTSDATSSTSALTERVALVPKDSANSASTETMNSPVFS